MKELDGIFSRYCKQVITGCFSIRLMIIPFIMNRSGIAENGIVHNKGYDSIGEAEEEYE